MREKRNSAWLREMLCDEIDAVREGQSDHSRAKAVALLAREVLKSVEVELEFRKQQLDMSGSEHEQLGNLPLCDKSFLSVSEPVLERRPVKSPIVPQGPLFIRGKNMSGSA